MDPDSEGSLEDELGDEMADLPVPEMKHQGSMKDFLGGSKRLTAMKQIVEKR